MQPARLMQQHTCCCDVPLQRAQSQCRDRDDSSCLPFPGLSSTFLTTCHHIWLLGLLQQLRPTATIHGQHYMWFLLSLVLCCFHIAVLLKVPPLSVQEPASMPSYNVFDKLLLLNLSTQWYCTSNQSVLGCNNVDWLTTPLHCSGLEVVQ